MATESSDQLRAGATLLGLDIGTQRIGVALARQDVRIASPLETLDASGPVMERIAEIIGRHDVAVIVAGWPRGLEGQHTAQTAAVEAFVAELRQQLDVKVELQDEALTSRKAEAELAGRRKPYTKADVDALAAVYILEDYMAEHLQGVQT